MVGTVPVPPRVRRHAPRRPDGSCSAPCQPPPGPLGPDPLVYPEGLTADPLPGVTRQGAVATRAAALPPPGGARGGARTSGRRGGTGTPVVPWITVSTTPPTADTTTGTPHAIASRGTMPN